MKIIEVQEFNEADYELLLLADPSRLMIESYIPHSRSFKASGESGDIAILVLYPIAHDRVEIKNIAVKAEYQNQGIGQAMIRFALEEARKSGYSSILIGTGNSSLGQLYLYQKLGFRLDHVVKNFFIEHYAEEIIENGLVCRDMIYLSKDLLHTD